VNSNTSLIWNGLLTLAVLTLFFLHFNGKKSSGGFSSSDSTALGGRKVVYVQVDSLLSQYEYFKDIRKDLEGKRYKLDYELNNRGKSLENEIAFFQQKAPTMTMEQGRSVEEQLMKKQQDFVQYRDREAQKLAQEELEKNEELYVQIYDYIDKYNDENEYEFVLGYSRGGGILYANKQLDVTDKVLAGLNEAYKEKQKKSDGKEEAKKDSTEAKKK
jgi:outer membrane protein